MIPTDQLKQEANLFFERSKTSRYIKSPDGYANHCYATAERCEMLFGEAYDNNEDVISRLLNPSNVLQSHNLKKDFMNDGYAIGLLHDIGDAYVSDELQLLASHFGRLLLETYGFSDVIPFSIGSSWVAEEELEVAQKSLNEDTAPLQMKRIRKWVMGLDPNDYIQNSVQQLICTAADAGDDLPSRIEKYIERRTDWGHHTLVQALTNNNNAGIKRLTKVYEKGNSLIEGCLTASELEKIGVIPLA